MKQITKEDMNLLLEKNIIQNSHRGMINKQNNCIGYYRSKNKIYIEDKYADIAKNLSKE